MSYTELQITSNFSFLRGCLAPGRVGRTSCRIRFINKSRSPIETASPELFAPMLPVKKIISGLFLPVGWMYWMGPVY